MREELARSKKLKSSMKGFPCVFCAGGASATTVDHVPPKILFSGKQRPRGYEFPACKACNEKSKQLDQVASFFFRANGAVSTNFSDDRELESLQIAIRNNTPEVFFHIDLSQGRKSELAANFGRDGFEVPVDRQLYRKFLSPWAAKIGLALWFEHTQKLFDSEQRLIIRWLQTEQVLLGGDTLDKLLGILPQLQYPKQGSKNFSDQFAYRFQINEIERLGGFLLLFHSAAACFAAITDERKLSLSMRSEISMGEMFKVSTRYGIEKALPLPPASR